MGSVFMREKIIVLTKMTAKTTFVCRKRFSLEGLIPATQHDRKTV